MKRILFILVMCFAAVLVLPAQSSETYGQVTCTEDDFGFILCEREVPGYGSYFNSFEEARNHYSPPMIEVQPEPTMILVNGGNTETLSGH